MKFYSVRILIYVSAMLFLSKQAYACDSRQEFFRNSDSASLAYIKDAYSLYDARAIYVGWCNVNDSSTQSAMKPKTSLFFALNNRSVTAGQPRYYIVKIYRRSRATALRPIFAFRLSGSWKNNCISGYVSKPKDKVVSLEGANPISVFMNIASSGTPGVDNRCSLKNLVSSTAYGHPDLNLNRDRQFFGNLPSGIRANMLGSWSLSISAFTFGTVSIDDRLAKYPILAINRDGADEMIVQYISSTSNFHEFSIR